MAGVIRRIATNITSRNCYTRSVTVANIKKLCHSRPVRMADIWKVNPFQGCTIEIVGVVSYSQNFAFGLVQSKLAIVVRAGEICLEIITVFCICDDPKNCTVICKKLDSWAQTSINIIGREKWGRDFYRTSTHALVLQCSPASVGLAQARPNHLSPKVLVAM